MQLCECHLTVWTLNVGGHWCSYIVKKYVVLDIRSIDLSCVQDLPDIFDDENDKCRNVNYHLYMNFVTDCGMFSLRVHERSLSCFCALRLEGFLTVCDFTATCIENIDRKSVV